MRKLMSHAMMIDAKQNCGIVFHLLQFIPIFLRGISCCKKPIHRVSSRPFVLNEANGLDISVHAFFKSIQLEKDFHFTNSLLP